MNGPIVVHPVVFVPEEPPLRRFTIKSPSLRRRVIGRVVCGWRGHREAPFQQNGYPREGLHSRVCTRCWAHLLDPRFVTFVSTMDEARVVFEERCRVGMLPGMVMMTRGNGRIIHGESLGFRLPEVG